MKLIVCVLLGYIVGMFNPAYLIGKAKGHDLKKEGSGNAGASNAIVVIGKGVGVACGLADIFKAFFIYRVCEAMFPGMASAGMLAGAGCILGHIYPVWMHFNGGKGLACLGGTILAYDWKIFLLMLAVEIVFVLLAGYICLVAISASVVFPAVYMLRGGTVPALILLLAVTVTMLFKHRENLRRIREGSELRISYLWNKEAELERVQNKK